MEGKDYPRPAPSAYFTSQYSNYWAACVKIGENYYQYFGAYHTEQEADARAAEEVKKLLQETKGK